MASPHFKSLFPEYSQPHRISKLIHRVNLVWSRHWKSLVELGHSVVAQSPVMSFDVTCFQTVTSVRLRGENRNVVWALAFNQSEGDVSWQYISAPKQTKRFNFGASCNSQIYRAANLGITFTFSGYNFCPHMTVILQSQGSSLFSGGIRYILSNPRSLTF